MTRRPTATLGRRAVAALTVVLTLAACTSDARTAGADDPMLDAGDASGTRPGGSGEDLGPAGEAPGAVPPPAGAVDARIAALDDLTAEVEAALADASARAGVAVEAIAVASALWVTWSDGSLGCPQPETAYTMALVSGYLLTLEVDGERVAYHGAAGEDPFPCGWPEGAAG